MKRMEFRIKDVKLDHSEDRKIGGYVNVTERESETLYSQQRGKWFKEVMKKGVFERALAKNQSIPCLLEHNWDKELAHTDKGTLELREDNIGLRFDAVIKDETVYEQVKAGIINSCSFGFRVLAEEVKSINTRLEKRFVSAIELLEVSLVKNPAYVGSLCETRSYEEELKEEERAKCGNSEEEKREENLEVETEEEKVEEVEQTEAEEVETEDESPEEAEEFDRDLKTLMDLLNDDDLLMITADHGNDPTWSGTDHTREYVPILVWGKKLKGGNLGTRRSFADIGATIAENFNVKAPEVIGKSFLSELK